MYIEPFFSIATVVHIDQHHSHTNLHFFFVYSGYSYTFAWQIYIYSAYINRSSQQQRSHIARLKFKHYLLHIPICMLTASTKLHIYRAPLYCCTTFSIAPSHHPKHENFFWFFFFASALLYSVCVMHIANKKKNQNVCMQCVHFAIYL